MSLDMFFKIASTLHVKRHFVLLAMDSLLHVPQSNRLSESDGLADIDLLLAGDGAQSGTDFLSGLLDGADANFMSDLFQTTTGSTSPPTSLYGSGLTTSPDSSGWLQGSPSSASDDGSNSPQYNQFMNNNNCIQSTAMLFNTPGQDIHIDVDIDSDLYDDLPSSTSDRKTGSITISEEERELLSREGITLPVDLPLTKSEEKHVKRIRRKLKNKQSAADSRKKKKVYVDGLERRVEKCTEMNSSLLKKVKRLESENESLVEQLKRLQAFISQYNPSKVQAGSFMMIVILSFSLLFVPQIYKSRNAIHTSPLSHSRSLLDISSDDFGNILKENTFVGASRNDRTPILPLPWQYQSPAFKLYNFSSPSEPQNSI